MTSDKVINKLLLDRCGVSADGRPKFRLVWSTHQSEVRKGELVTEGGIVLCDALGVATQTVRVPKYEASKDRWILERLLFIPPTPELPGSGNGDYEPVWIFEDREGNYLKPEWFAIEYILYRLEQGPVGSASYWKSVDAQRTKERKAKIARALGLGGASPIEAAFRTREIVPMHGKYTAS